MSHSVVPLSSLIKPAKTIRAGKSSYPVLSMTMRGGLVDQAAKFKKRVASEDTSSYKVIRKNQLVVGFPIDEGVLSFQKLYPEAIVSPAYDVWDVITPEISIDYLEKFLRGPLALTFYSQKLQGSTARRRTLPDDVFLSLAVPLPPIPEQRRIAAILDQVDTLRAKRREALAQLDSLTQSIFIEMFGDPIENPKGWPAATLGTLIHSASDGPHVSPTYAESGIPFLSTRHVRPGEISWNDMKYLTREEAKIQWRKCKPTREDILYTKGGTTGLAAVVRTDEEFAVWVHIALLKPNNKLVDSTWLEAMLNSQYCYRQSQELTHGIANRDLGLKRMVKIDMYHPPLKLQREFTRRMEQLADQKRLQQLALTELDALFASLQHLAFRREL